MTITVTERTLNKRVERISSHSGQTIRKNEISLDLPQLVRFSFKELPLPSEPDYFSNYNKEKHIIKDDSAVHKLILALPNNLFKLNLVVFCPGKIYLTRMNFRIIQH